MEGSVGELEIIKLSKDRVSKLRAKREIKKIFNIAYKIAISEKKKKKKKKI